MGGASDRTARFLTISSALTAFDRVELQGTGLVDGYLRELIDTIGEAEADRFLIAASTIVERGTHVERDLLGDVRLGPLARNIIRMWYLGTWQQLPDGWYPSGGRLEKDMTRVLSPQAYVESLVWRAIDSHPPAAKQPGFGSWSLPPGPRGSRK